MPLSFSRKNLGKSARTIRSFLVTTSSVKVPSLTSLVKANSFILQLVSCSGETNVNRARPSLSVVTMCGLKKAVSANSFLVSTFLAASSSLKPPTPPSFFASMGAIASAATAEERGGGGGASSIS